MIGSSGRPISGGLTASCSWRWAVRNRRPPTLHWRPSSTLQPPIVDSHIAHRIDCRLPSIGPSWLFSATLGYLCCVHSQSVSTLDCPDCPITNRSDSIADCPITQSARLDCRLPITHRLDCRLRHYPIGDADSIADCPITQSVRLDCRLSITHRLDYRLCHYRSRLPIADVFAIADCRLPILDLPPRCAATRVS